MKYFRNILLAFFIFVSNEIKVIVNLTKDDILDIIEIVSFGLIINALYGIIKLNDMSDFYILVVSLYMILKIKHYKKGQK